MPIVSCTKDGNPGYKYGEGNKSCFTYTEGNEASRKEAKRKAILQGTAIAQRSGEKLELSKEDLEELEKDFEVGLPKYEPIIKDESNHCLFGWTYVSQNKDGEQIYDHSGEFLKEENFEDLEMAVYLFNIAYRQADIRHNCIAKGQLIESVVMTKEKQRAMGIPEGIVPLGVWQGYWFPEDEDWNEIMKMKAPMYSLYGKVVKELVEEVEEDE